MLDGLRQGYGRLRTVPLLGALTSRLVWAVKAALGAPVAHPPPRPSSAPSPPAPSVPVASQDIKLKVMSMAAERLDARFADLPPPPRAPQNTDHRRPIPGSMSVIVSTLDRADWLDRALSGLAYQRHPAFEIIVVVGPCSDHTDEMVGRHGGHIRTAGCPVANLSVSRNIGISLARGEFVAFLDDDAVPEPDWLQRLQAPYADPAVGGVGGYIRDATGLDYQCRVMVCDRFGRSAEVGDIRQARLDPPGPSADRFLSLTGTNSSFRRSALLAVGGFDEAYAYFLDETDVCLRMVEAGWRLVIAPEAQVHHAYAPNAQRRADRAPLSLAACVRSTAYFTLRNAAPRHGLSAAADHLQAYVDRLRHDTAWRCAHGVLTAADAERLLAEIDREVVEGVRAALVGPRRLMSDDGADAAEHPVRMQRPSTVYSPTLRPEMERLRLCLLCQDYPTGGARDDLKPPGGVAVWSQALGRAMAARGHEVTILARAGQDEPCARFEAEGGAGLWVHRIASPPAARSRRRQSQVDGLPASIADPAIALAREIGRLSPRRRFDLIMGPLWDLEPCALDGRGDTPVAVSLHTACAQVAAFKPEWDSGYRRAHVDKVIAGERRLLKRAPHVLANTYAAARDIGATLDLADLAGRATVIPHGLPDLARGVAPQRREAGVEVLFVGRLEDRKGIDVLLAAAPEVLAAAPHVRITLIGEDVSAPGARPWRERFSMHWGGAPWFDRVRFEGPSPRTELLARYAACDIVVVPSRYESFGLTALEAMIFAKPCVAAAAGGLPEVVSDGVTGLLYAPCDAGALATALLRLIGAPNLRATMGAAARRRYEAGFTADAMAQAFETWMRDISQAQMRFAAE